MTDSHELAKRTEQLPGPASVLHPAVAQLLDANPTPEALREILALQREHEHEVSRRAFTCALVDLRAELPAWLERDALVEFPSDKGKVRYTHTTLASVMDAVQPILPKHGFALTWTPSTEKGVTVTAKLTHRGGHSENCSLTAPPDSGGRKSPAQAIASTITLLQRYTALSLLGIATGDQREPTGEKPADPERVDTDLNLRAVAACAERGLSREAAEELVGRTAEQWRRAELEQLRDWLRKAGAEGQDQPDTKQEKPICVIDGCLGEAIVYREKGDRDSGAPPWWCSACFAEKVNTEKIWGNMVSQHARERMEERDISEGAVAWVLEHPGISQDCEEPNRRLHRAKVAGYQSEVVVVVDEKYKTIVTVCWHEEQTNGEAAASLDAKPERILDDHWLKTDEGTKAYKDFFSLANKLQMSQKDRENMLRDACGQPALIGVQLLCAPTPDEWAKVVDQLRARAEAGSSSASAERAKPAGNRADTGPLMDELVLAAQDVNRIGDDLERWAQKKLAKHSDGELASLHGPDFWHALQPGDFAHLMTILRLEKSHAGKRS